MFTGLSHESSPRRLLCIDQLFDLRAQLRQGSLTQSVFPVIAVLPTCIPPSLPSGLSSYLLFCLLSVPVCLKIQSSLQSSKLPAHSLTGWPSSLTTPRTGPSTSPPSQATPTHLPRLSAPMWLPFRYERDPLNEKDERSSHAADRRWQQTDDGHHIPWSLRDVDAPLPPACFELCGSHARYETHHFSFTEAQ